MRAIRLRLLLALKLLPLRLLLRLLLRLSLRLGRGLRLRLRLLLIAAEDVVVCRGADQPSTRRLRLLENVGALRPTMTSAST